MYDDVDDMWRDLVRDLLTTQKADYSRDGQVCGELIGWTGELDASQQRTLLTHPARKLSAAYAAAETLWYLSGSDKVAMLKNYAPSYERFGDEAGRAYGAYGARAFAQFRPYGMSLVEFAVWMLRKSPASRQAVVSLWRPDDLVKAYSGECKDIPCTLDWQFLVRDDRLHMSAVMRSNDAWLGFPYDLFAFTCVQRIVAAMIDVKVGPYRHFVVGSMHLYERHRDRAAAVLGGPQRAMSAGHGWRLDDTLDSCRVAVELEAQCRAAGRYHPTPRHAAMGDMAQDLFAAAVGKLTGDPLIFPTKSKRMRDLCS